MTLSSKGPYRSTDRAPLVEVDGVTRSFVHEGRKIEVLKGISLSIHQGEMVCIVGSSGTGKSTLLHLMGTLDLPTTGRILYDGIDVTKLASSSLAAFRNRSIGFVFQFHHLLPEFTALENVMMPGLIANGNKSEYADRAAGLLKDVGLDHRHRHRPGELSGGEQQRVALARALIMDPKMVFADEPTGNLDTNTSDAIHRLLFDLNERRGTSFLIVTHNRELAERMPRVILMRDGLIESDDTNPEPGSLRPDADGGASDPIDASA